MKKKIFYFVLISMLATAIALPEPASAATRLKWGSTSVRSNGYAITVLYAKATNKAYKRDIQVTVVETGGYVENLARMKRRLLHVAGVNPILAYEAYKGIGNFKGKGNPRLRMLWSQAIQPFSFVAAKDSGITTLDQLNGAKMASNKLTTSETLGRMFLAAIGIKPNYRWAGTAANLEAMKAKTVDAWARPGFNYGAFTELTLSRPLNYLNVTQEQIDEYNQKHPGYGALIESKAGQYPGQDKSYNTLAFIGGDMIDKDVSAEVAYKIVKANYEKRLEQAKVDATLRKGGWSNFPELSMKTCLVPLHPGAIKFYKEDLKMTIPARLIPPKMK
jgi:TRAP transporter TAXI family solute receptor